MTGRFARTLLLALASVVLLATPVFAYLYRAPVTITENASTSHDMLPVLWNQNNTWLASNGFMNSTANDTRVQTLGGLNKPWTVADNKTLTAVPVPADSQTNLYFATGESEASAMDIILGYGGYITVSDDADLELGDNFTIEQKGWVDTDNGTDKNLVYKQDAFRTYVSSTVSGNITSSINAWDFQDYFDTDLWTDVGTKIHVTIGGSRINYEAERSTIDERCYYDLTATDDTGWRLDFKWHPTSKGGVNGRVALGLWDALANWNGFPGDAIVLYVIETSANIQRYDGGAVANSSGISFVHGTTYYVTLQRTSAIGVVLSIYSDAERITHIAGSPKTWAIPATVGGLRYIGISNYDDNNGEANEQIGWIDTLKFNDNTTSVTVTVTATGVSSGEHTVKTTADGTNLKIYIDDVEEDSTALGGASVTDGANDWTIDQNNVMPYMDYYKHTVNGTLVGWYQPNDIISGTTLPDRAGTAEDGVITWGSNPAGVGATVGSMSSSGQPDIGATSDTSTSDLLPVVGGTNWNPTPGVSAKLQANPMRPIVVAVSDNTTLSEYQVWVLLGIIFVVFVTVLVGANVRGHHLVTGIAASVAIILMVVWTVFPLLALIVVVLAIWSGLVSERSPSL